MGTAAFHDRAVYRPEKAYSLLPFRFGRLDAERYILTNDVGEYTILARDDLTAFVDRALETDGLTYRDLKSKHFLFDGRRH